jgi:hypothetical protein
MDSFEQGAGRQRRRIWGSGRKVGPASRDGAKERRVVTLRLSGSFAVANAHAEVRRM